MIEVSSAFSTANVEQQKLFVHAIEIDTYTRVFIRAPREGNTLLWTLAAGQYDWIESIADLKTSIKDLDGSADLGQLVFTVSDVLNQITADFPGFVFEGKKVTLKSGFVGMDYAAFAILFVGIVDSIASVNSGASYEFTCTDNTQRLTQYIYTVGDDGKPTSADHPRTLNGHPIDLAIAALGTELGLSSTADFNRNKLLQYRDGVFAGLNFVFSITTPPQASDFLANQIMKELGGYMWTNSRGQIDFNFFYRDSRPFIAPGSLIAAFTDGTGQLVGNPLFVGNGVSVIVPAGATQVQLGVNDNVWSDNTGSWQVSVNGASAVTVDGKAAPWLFTAGINSAYPFVVTGSGSPTVVSVTAGTTITIAWVSGTVSLHFGVGSSDGNGNSVDFTPSGVQPGDYAHALPTPLLSQFSLTDDNIKTIPEASQADLVNSLLFSFDKASGNSSTYLANALETFADSISRYGLYGASSDIQSDGMRSGFQGFFLAALTSRMVFYRYGLKNLVMPEVVVFWPACVLEPGDIADMTTNKVPDREAGVMGISGKLFEILDRTLNFTEGTATFRLLDASYLTKFGQYRIAPDSTAAFTSASTDEKTAYMFLANDSDQYSDTTPAHQLG